MVDTDLPMRMPRFSRLRWTLRFDRPAVLPRFPGSALRGLLGHGLRKTACIMQRDGCTGCLLADSCAYTRLFEPSAARRGAARVPYVLAVPVATEERPHPCDLFRFEMTLLEPCLQDFPYLLQAMRLAGRRGLGRRRSRFEVVAVEAQRRLGTEAWETIYRDGRCLALPEPVEASVPPMPDAVELTWLTPFRFKHRGRLVGPEAFGAGILMESLLHRVHGVLGERPPRTALDQVRRLRLDARSEATWQEWSRFSSRQRTRMQIGGVSGRLYCTLPEAFAPWWPLFWLGQWLHVGKLVSMGLGRYRLWPQACQEVPGPGGTLSWPRP